MHNGIILVGLSVLCGWRIVSFFARSSQMLIDNKILLSYCIIRRYGRSLRIGDINWRFLKHRLLFDWRQRWRTIGLWHFIRRFNRRRLWQIEVGSYVGKRCFPIATIQRRPTSTGFFRRKIGTKFYCNETQLNSLIRNQRSTMYRFNIGCMQ